jgi:hypothetical protein
MNKHAFTGSYASQDARGAQGMLFPEDRLCAQSHYAAIVDATKDVEIYHLGDVDCQSCLQRMADKHAAVAAVFRERLSNLAWAREARALWPDAPRALCHECAEMVPVVGGKLDPHHGATGDGCSQNGADAQIYLHPKVADRIAELETALAFGPRGDR